MEIYQNSGDEPAKSSSGAFALKSEFRLDTTSGLWALIVEGRGNRPSNTEPVHLDTCKNNAFGVCDKSCNFCPGNEGKTPEIVALAALKKNAEAKNELEVDDVELLTPKNNCEVEGRKWFARVVENKYPAFQLGNNHVDLPTFDDMQNAFYQNENLSFERFFNTIPGEGRHEVIVDSPRHVRSWSDLNELEIRLAFRIFRMRLKALMDSKRLAYSFIFKNVGANAGASQQHSHCQLTGNVELPPNIQVELERLAKYEQGRKARGEKKSYWGALLDAEISAKERIVFLSDRFVVYCPYASRFPMQLEVCPRFDDRFEFYDDDALDELALLLRNSVAALEKAKSVTRPNDPTLLDYNVIMKNAPANAPSNLLEFIPYARARWTILPSLVKKAGYEIGSGVDINPVAPESAARLIAQSF